MHQQIIADNATITTVATFEIYTYIHTIMQAIVKQLMASTRINIEADFQMHNLMRHYIFNYY